MTTLREPLVHFVDGEAPDAYLARALQAAKDATGGRACPRLRLEVGSAFSFGDRQIQDHCSVSLWVERGSGRSESWQKVTGSILGESYEAVLGLFTRALDGDL